MENDPMQWGPECRSLNETSGLIRLAGRVTFVNLIATIKRSEASEEGPERL